MLEWEMIKYEPRIVEVRIMAVSPEHAAAIVLAAENDGPVGWQLRSSKISRHGERGRRRLVKLYWLHRNKAMSADQPWKRFAAVWLSSKPIDAQVVSPTGR